MNMNFRVVLLFTAAFWLKLPCSYSQNDCLLPTKADLESVIARFYQGGDGSTSISINVTSFNIVCRAHSREEGRLRGISAVVEYTCNGSSTICPQQSLVIEQIETSCSGGIWLNSVLGNSNTSNFRSSPDGSSLSTPARNDCYLCVSPQILVVAAPPEFQTDSITHCLACHSDCTGLKQCHGFQNTSCCNYYNNSVCATECPSPFLPDASYNCVCPVGSTGLSCSECGLLCQNDGVPDINCATCSCSSGYTGTYCEEDINECSISSPCTNGDCINTRGGFTCSCFPGFTGDQCDTNIDECTLGTHACHNGVCIDEVPGYRCQCLEGFTGEKCDICELAGCERCTVVQNSRGGGASCLQCSSSYSLTSSGHCEILCGVQNCAKCNFDDGTRCNECENDYRLNSDGTCSAPPRSAPPPSSSDTDNELSDFVISAIIAGAIIFLILLMALCVCVWMGIYKYCKRSQSQPGEKHDDVQRARHRRENPTYINSYMEAQMTFEAEEVNKIDMIDTIEEEDEEAEEKEEELESWGEGEGGERIGGQTEDDSMPLTEI